MDSKVGGRNLKGHERVFPLRLSMPANAKVGSKSLRPHLFVSLKKYKTKMKPF